MIYRIVVLFLCGITTVLGMAAMVSAQYYADITLSITPKYPKPGDLVTASVTSSDVNLEFQEISWYVNGKASVSGVAQTSAVFRMEQNVDTYQVRAVVGSAAGQVVRELTISPGQVILLWEAVDSYTPHWYRGKALMPAEGLVRITAIPVGADSLDKLFFLWKQRDVSLGSQSGHGRNSIIVRNNILLDTVDVSVQVSSATGAYQAQGEISIPRTNSDIRLWSPNTGFAPTFEQSNTLTVFGNESTVEAIPYYLPSRSGTTGLSYEWKLNAIDYIHRDGEAENSLYVARSPSPLIVELMVRSIDHLLQEVHLQKRIIFD